MKTDFGSEGGQRPPMVKRELPQSGALAGVGPPLQSEDLSPSHLAELYRRFTDGATTQERFGALKTMLDHGYFFRPGEPATLLSQRAQVARFTPLVSLDHSRPRIWRRLSVRSDLRLDRLNDVIEAAMGWNGVDRSARGIYDERRHSFRMGGSACAHSRQAFLTVFDIYDGEEDGIAETDVRVDETLGQVGDRLFYEHDDYAGWAHTITLTAIGSLAGSDQTIAAQVTAGRRACPQEYGTDVYLHNDMVAARPDPTQADDQGAELMWWLRDADPAEFDLADAQRSVAVAVANGEWRDRNYAFSRR